MTVGEKIQDVLDWSDKDQKDLARMTGIPRSSISDYVRGAREPSLEAIRKIATALEVSPWAIMNGEGLPVETIDITSAEREILAEYRKLTAPERKAVDNIIYTFNLRK